MSNITEANVEQFKTEHECDEHWELRRKFLLTHGGKFPPDELQCLAQVFTNVEFLGCKYPQETMRMIAELSKDVVQSYRDKQKSRLQRTFVGASDAASSKAKGQSRQERPAGTTSSPNTGPNLQSKYQSLANSFTKAQESPTEDMSIEKKSIEDRSTENKSTEDSSTRSRSPIRFPASNINATTSKGEPSRNNYQSPPANFNKSQESAAAQSRYPTKRKKLNNQAAEIVLFEYLNDTPQSIIARAANSNDINLEWKYDRAGVNVTCAILFNKHKMGQGAGPNQKAAKKEASLATLEELRKHYYTIKVTKNLTPTVTGKIAFAEEPKSNALGSDNIGSKMMKMMGWSGGGLGKSAQGITEPIKVDQQMTREGLGLKVGSYSINVFKKKCLEVLQNYIRGDTSTDLVFSPHFSSDERAVIHQIAQQIGLKSQSYGPKAQRILTISRKIHPRELVKELLELGGVTEKYQLIEPAEI